ncbi:hypothetical protein LINPERPRIM_LOCUS28208 [Linum perenne]
MENKYCSAKLVLFLALFIFVANEVEGICFRIGCPKKCKCKAFKCRCRGEEQRSPAMISSDDKCRPDCPEPCVCSKGQCLCG